MENNNIKQNLQNSRENFVKNNEKPLDNDQKNSYISGSGEDVGDNSANTQGKDLNKTLLESTFNNDPEKLAEAYRNQMSETTKIIQDKKRLEQEVASFRSFREKLTLDERLASIVEKVEKGEDYRNLLGTNESTDKHNVSDTVKKPSQLNSTIDEQSLIQAGVLDGRMKDQVSPYEWSRMVAEATIEYMPNIIADRSYSAYQQKIAEHEKQQEHNKLVAEADNRFKGSFDRFIANNKVDFVGEHQDLLDEIYQVATSYRDPADRRLPRQNAFELAAKEVFESKGIQLESSIANRQQPKNTNLTDTFQVNGRVDKTGKAKTIAELRKEQLTKTYNNKVNLYTGFKHR